MNERRYVPLRRSLTHCLLAVLSASDITCAVAAGQSVSPRQRSLTGTLQVTSCADDASPGTLRNVVATAASGDTVDLTQLTCGAITLLTGQIEVHVDDLTIEGPGQDTLAIDGNYNGRVLHHDGVGTLTISDLTIRHGVADASAGNPSDLQAAWGGCILSSHYTQQTNTLGAVALIASSVTDCKATSVPSAGQVFINGARGGGIFASSHVVLDHATVSDNVASSPYGYLVLGGGIYTQGGVGAEPSVITASTISGNRSESIYNSAAQYQGFNQAQGGGLRLGTDASITDSVVSNNFVGCDTASVTCSFATGGGIFAIASLTLTTSVVANNVIEAGGLGSVWLIGAGITQSLVPSYALTINDSTITGNEARKPESDNCVFCSGGGVSISGNGDVQITASTISRNVSVGNGGGIYGAYTHLTVANSTISGNSSAVGGAVFWTGFQDYNYPMTMRSSTVTSNSAVNGGGIVDNHAPVGGSSNFESTIVAGNVNTDATATYGADVASSQAGAALMGANNLIVDATDVTLPLDTIHVDPMLGPLQDNGGATWTHALQSGSPAIDSGNNIGNLTFDQRGTGFLRVMGAAADIGAFEVQIGIPDAIFANGFDGVSP